MGCKSRRRTTPASARRGLRRIAGGACRSEIPPHPHPRHERRSRPRQRRLLHIPRGGSDLWSVCCRAAPPGPESENAEVRKTRPPVRVSVLTPARRCGGRDWRPAAARPCPHTLMRPPLLTLQHAQPGWTTLRP